MLLEKSAEGIVLICCNKLGRPELAKSRSSNKKLFDKEQRIIDERIYYSQATDEMVKTESNY